MKPTLQIQGNVARSCHPWGCREAIKRQIDYVQQAPEIRGPRNVLILGASSGYGLAARIACAFGGPGANTLGVSVERGPDPDRGIGTAGWYNNVFFSQFAQQAGLKALNIQGDAFSPDVQVKVIETVLREFDGKLDLVIYSLASGRRTTADGHTWHSAIKALGEPFSGPAFDLEHQTLSEKTLTPATADEVLSTVKVMGGEPWQEWINLLLQANILAPDAKTVAFSYLGPESSWPIYRDGTLGVAKTHLHDTANRLHDVLAKTGGGAYVAVCKALVTKASAYIPLLPVYITLLYRVMKAKRLHEGCIEQMHRLLFDHVYPAQGPVLTDPTRLIRLDDRELRADVQHAVDSLSRQITAENFRQLGDFEGYLKEFEQLNGFGFDNVDYQQPISWSELEALKP